MTPGPMFTPLASADIEQAYGWYEEQRPGLGAQFVSALRLVWVLLERFPDVGPELHHGLRRVLVPKFPYAVYYRHAGPTIEVRGCLHQHRNPKAWRRRA